MSLKFFRSSVWKSVSSAAVFMCVLAAVPWLGGAPIVDTVTKLVPSDISPNLFFGTSVVIDNGLAAVGAPDVDSGAVYTYALVGGAWVQTQKLTQPAPACGTNEFGIALALQDGVLAVAEPVGCVEVGPGQVFIYRLVAGTWVLQQQIQPFPAFPFSGFGTSLALSGNTLAVGNPADGSGPGGGTVSIYTNDATGFFFFQAKVAAPSNTFQAFTGTSVALEGDTLVAGAPGFTVAGAAYVFQRFGTNWTFQSTIREAFTTAADFGRSAASQGGILVIGAPGDSDTNGILGGAAYANNPFQKLTPTNNVRGLGFGTSVSVFNGTVVVGIPFRTVNGKTNAGAADIFVSTGTNFVLAQEITAPDPSSGAEFGDAVNIGASGIIVGAPFDSSIVTNGGAAYIFSPSETNQPVIVSASASPNVLFPPNHKLIPVTISITTQGNVATCKIKQVTSNQPVNGTGDGNTSPDWIITGDLTVLLRAERAGNIKTDRVYSITVQCTDTFGNSASTVVRVTVPHDRGK
jgi:hypothetical protein